jgi:DNA-directed RNA polymerase beta' subunit
LSLSGTRSHAEAEGLPAKGGEAGSKLVSLMDVHALLSHGATEVIRDAGAIRGQAHPEFWAQFMAGYDPPLPKVPPVYEKFLDQLRGAGLNPVRSAQKTHLLALTNRGVDELAGDRELQNAETVDWKDLQKPIKGGLFDETLTGGHGGNRWAAIRLHEPMPNPAMEDPIRRMLDLTEKEFREVLAGRRELRGRTGPGAIRGALEAINVDREIEHARQEINSGKKTHRDVAVRKLGYLKAAQKHGLHPRDWVLDRVPVLPPRFRPVSLMQGSKLPMIADPNMLYKELLDANSNLKDMSSLVDDVGDERTAVYDAFKAVVGLGDPLHPKNRERQVKGILKHVFGNSPKTGTVQRKLISSPTDLVGRAVISPDPNLEMDQIGVPEARAWEVYQPFIVRRLVRRGMPRLQALREVKERGENARKAMLAEMEVRPIVTNQHPRKAAALARLAPLARGGAAILRGDLEQLVVAEALGEHDRRGL